MIVYCHWCGVMTTRRPDGTYRVHYPTALTVRPCRESWQPVRATQYPFARLEDQVRHG